MLFAANSTDYVWLNLFKVYEFYWMMLLCCFVMMIKTLA